MFQRCTKAVKGAGARARKGTDPVQGTPALGDNDSYALGTKQQIQPGDDKSRWENAARVLKDIGSSSINREIPKLLEWLADLNWPGAMTVMELLATVDLEVLVPYVTEAREKAAREADEMWLDALDQLLESL